MSFLDRPYDATRTPRTTRNAPLEACALTRPEPSTGHRWVPVACLLAGLFVVFIIILEHL